MLNIFSLVYNLISRLNTTKGGQKYHLGERRILMMEIVCQINKQTICFDESINLQSRVQSATFHNDWCSSEAKKCTYVDNKRIDCSCPPLAMFEIHCQKHRTSFRKDNRPTREDFYQEVEVS